MKRIRTDSPDCTRMETSDPFTSCPAIVSCLRLTEQLSQISTLTQIHNSLACVNQDAQRELTESSNSAKVLRVKLRQI